MAFSRLSYDDCAYSKTLNESTGPFKYVTNPIAHQASEQCFMGYPGFNSAMVGNQGIRPETVDVESELRNQTRLASNCPTKKYNPKVNCRACDNCNQGLPCGCLHCNAKNPHSLADCSKEIVPVQSRSFNACSDLNGIFINRFQPLCEDPQGLDKIHSNDYIGMDTRNVVKDQAAAKYDFREMAKNAHFKDLPSPVAGLSYSHVDDFASQLQPGDIVRFDKQQRDAKLSEPELTVAQRNLKINRLVRSEHNHPTHFTN